MSVLAISFNAPGDVFITPAMPGIAAMRLRNSLKTHQAEEVQTAEGTYTGEDGLSDRYADGSTECSVGGYDEEVD